MGNPLTAGLEARLRRTAAAARTSADLAADDREARDDVIEEADQAGIKQREIARIVGLAAPVVHRIILKRTARRQR